MTNIELRTYEAHASMCHQVSNHLGKVDWEQRRYEIAKDVLAGYAASHKGLLPADAQSAVRCADALIAELKRTAETK